MVAGRQASAAAPSGRGRWTVVRTTARASRLASDGHGGLDLVDPEGSGGPARSTGDGTQAHKSAR